MLCSNGSNVSAKDIDNYSSIEDDHADLLTYLDELKISFRTDSTASHNTLDSLRSIYHEEESLLAYIDYYDGIFRAWHNDGLGADELLSNALKLSRALTDHRLEALTLMELGKRKSSQGNNSGALELFSEALKAAEKADDYRSLAATYSLMGNIYRILGMYEEAIEHITKAETQYAQLNYHEGQAWVEYSLANIYKDLELYDEALEYLNKSLMVYRDHVSTAIDSPGVAICLDQIGNIYYSQNELEKARRHVTRSHRIHSKARRDHGMAITNKNLGKIEFKLGNYDKALEHLYKARDLKQQSKDVLVLTSIFEYMGRSLFELGQHQEGIDSVWLGLNLATQSGQLNQKNRLHGVLADMYFAQGQLEEAYDHLSQQVKLNELLAKRLASVKITGIKNYHEREARRQQILTLQFENELIKLNLEKQRSRQYILGIGIISAILFSILISFLFYSKRETLLLVNAQRKELEELVTTKNKFFSIISHDLRGPLGGILQLTTTMAEMFPKLSKEKLLELVQSIGETSRRTFRLLENLLVWSRFQTGAMQVKKVEVDLRESIETELSLQAQRAKEKHIDLDNLVRGEVWVSADPDMLGTILRNLISNAVKFTHHGGKVTIRAESVDNTIQIHVQDTGIGIPTSEQDTIFNLENQYRCSGTEGEKSNGLGLILVREFVEEMGGEVSLSSVENKGSTFSFTISQV